MVAATTGRALPGSIPTEGLRTDIARTVRSEFTKVRSVRSTYWTLILMVVAGIAWSATYCVIEASQWAHMSPQDRIGFDPTQSSILGFALLGQLVIVVFGALAITSEYSTGMMHTSLTVMPRRLVLYCAKAAVVAAVTLVVAVPTSFASFFLGQALLKSTHVGATLSQPGVLGAVIATALYVTLCSLFAFGLGAVLRHTAGAITVAFGLLFLVSQLAKALPGALYAEVEKWLPSGDTVVAITGTVSGGNQNLFFAWGELAVFASYTVILLIAGAVLFGDRDA
jgi:ABC-2 type transport system permease protein